MALGRDPNTKKKQDSELKNLNGTLIRGSLQGFMPHLVLFLFVAFYQDGESTFEERDHV